MGPIMAEVDNPEAPHVRLIVLERKRVLLLP